MADTSPVSSVASSHALFGLTRLARIATWLVLISISAEAAAQDQPPTATTSELAKLVLEQERTTPAQIVDGVLLLLDLNAVEPAATLFARLTALNLSEDDQVKLAREVGTAKLMRLARSSQLGEAAREWVQSATAAVERRVRDPQRIADSIKQLADPAIAQRTAAMIQLLEAGPAAAPPVVAALGQPQFQQQRQALREVLIRLDPSSRGPLLAAFDSHQPRLIAEIIPLSAKLEPKRAAPYLAALAVTTDPTTAEAAEEALAAIGIGPRSDATAVLTAAIDEQLAGAIPARPDSEGQVEVWLWNEEAAIPVAYRLPATDAGVVAAARLARRLVMISPDNRQHYGPLAIATQLEAAAILAAADENAASALRGQAFEGVAPDSLNQALAWALKREYFRAATALAEKLGSLGNASLLATSAPEPSPLVQAASSGYRPLQVAAIVAIAELTPEEPFAGSSRVVDMMKFLGSSTGESQVIVAMPNPQKALTSLGSVGRTRHRRTGRFHGTRLCSGRGGISRRRVRIGRRANQCVWDSRSLVRVTEQSADGSTPDWDSGRG